MLLESWWASAENGEPSEDVSEWQKKIDALMRRRGFITGTVSRAIVMWYSVLKPTATTPVPA